MMYGLVRERWQGFDPSMSPGDNNQGHTNLKTRALRHSSAKAQGSSSLIFGVKKSEGMEIEPIGWSIPVREALNHSISNERRQAMPQPPSFKHQQRTTPSLATASF